MNKKIEVVNSRLRFLVFSFMFFVLMVSGCNESLKMVGHSGSFNVGKLVPKARQIISEGLVDEDPRVRAKTIEVVAATRQMEMMGQVRRLLKDDFVPVRFAAALAVGDTKYHLAKRSVQELLKDTDQNVRIGAAYALYKLGSAEQFGLLGEAISSKDQTVRANAALLLGKSGNKNSLKPLYWVMNDGDSNDKARFVALEAIARLGDKTILKKRLWAIVFSSYADDRMMGIRAIGNLGTLQAKDVLITKLDDDVVEVRMAAAEQLGMLGDTTGEPEVVEVFTGNLTKGLDKREIDHVHMMAALAIGQIGTPPVVKFLPQLLKTESKSVRIAAAKAVLQSVKRQ